MFEKLKERGFEILALHHAEAILTHDMGAAVAELEQILESVELPVRELVESGGGEGKLTQRIRRDLSQRFGWVKHNFEIKKIVDGEEKESISHEIDHVKKFGDHTFALEIEWNNKDPFYDRDLENFKRLHADGVISVGGIITRGRSLQDAIPRIILDFAKRQGIGSFDDLSAYYEPTSKQKAGILRAVKAKGAFPEGWSHAFVKSKFGEASTHWRKLETRVARGVGNPCPLLLIGLPANIIV